MKYKKLILIFLILEWAIIYICVVISYLMFKIGISKVLMIFITALLAALTSLQIVALEEQTNLLASPVIDVVGRLTPNTYEIEIEIANVGNYVARKPQIIVDVETKDRIFRYYCVLFPSLPSRSYYCMSENIIKIKPKFKLGYRELDIVDLLTLIKRLQSESVAQVSIRAIFVAKNHKPVTLFEEVRSLDKSHITIVIFPKYKFLQKIKRKILRKQVIEYWDQRRFEIRSL